MNESIIKENKRNEILKIATPVFVELLLGTLFGMVDMMMLGHFGGHEISTASIAAVGITNQLIFIGLSLVQALNVGATAMVARYIGGKREDKIESVVKHIIILTQVLLVVPILILGLGFTEELMHFFGAKVDAIAIGKDYFKIATLGFAFQSFNFSIFAALRGAGDTKTPMNINIKVNLLNVVGNAILIYGLFGIKPLGINGAGISTTFSQFVALIFVINHLRKSHSVIKLNIKDKFHFDKDVIYNLIKIGLPASLEQIAFRLGVLLFVKIVASLGTVAYATHQICLNILNLSFTPGQAFGIAASTLTGRSLGSDEQDEAEAYIKECQKIGVVISIFMMIMFFFFGKYVAMLYSDDPAVLKEAAKILKLMAFTMPFQCSQLILSGGLRGAGDTVWTLISTFVGVLGVRIIIAYYLVLVLKIGLVGAWIAVFIDQFTRWLVITLRFRTNNWKYIALR